MRRLTQNIKNIVLSNEWLASIIVSSWISLWMIFIDEWSLSVEALLVTTTWTLTYFVVSIVVDNVRDERN